MHHICVLQYMHLSKPDQRLIEYNKNIIVLSLLLVEIVVVLRILIHM